MINIKSAIIPALISASLLISNPVLANTNLNSSLSAPFVEMAEENISSDCSCFANPTDVRESALASAFDEFVSAEKAALANRQNALKNAFDNSDTKAAKQSVKIAWKEYKGIHKAIAKSYDEKVKSAWRGYKNAIDECSHKDDIRDAEDADKNDNSLKD